MLKNAIITGSQTTSDELKLQDVLLPVNGQIFNERVRYSKIDKAAANTDSIKKSIENQLTTLAKTRTSIVTKFIEDNPDSYLSLWAICDVAGLIWTGKMRQYFIRGSLQGSKIPPMARSSPAS